MLAFYPHKIKMPKYYSNGLLYSSKNIKVSWFNKYQNNFTA